MLRKSVPHPQNIPTSLLSWRAVPCDHYATAGDPLDAPDGLGLQSRTIATYVLKSDRPQTNPLRIHPATVSVARAFGTARPPLRVPTTLGDVTARKALIKSERELKNDRKSAAACFSIIHNAASKAALPLLREHPWCSRNCRTGKGIP